MEAQHKKVLKAVSLELRHLLEGTYDGAGQWHPGDLEQRLAAIGARRDRESVKADELPHLSLADQRARQVVDAYLQLRAEAGVAREQAVAEFVRETAYTWANRLLALRCMEARELIDEVILQKPAYGGRSLEHHRLAQRQPDLCAGEDDGLLTVLDKVFAEQARHLPMLFDPEAPGVALKPSAAAIKRCMALLSDSQKVGDQDVATSDVFKAPDAFGWAYQYWNTEEKDRVFTKVRTQKGAKIEGADIIPATQLYTESYMVKFLVQNSLGATWMDMHPESKLSEKWEYYVRDADRAPVEQKPVAEITFLDPACGSGHFLLEAFDLFYDMYGEEGQITEPEGICRSILENNLYGIDIDARAVQIAEVALWMKVAERAFGFEGKPTNLVAAVASHLKGPLWEEFLTGFEREPSVARVLRKFGQAMEHIDELGSLARPNEELRAIIHEEHGLWEQQVSQKKEANFLFTEMAVDKLSGQLPFHEISDEEFGDRMLYRARAAIHAFTEQARQAGTFQDQFLGCEATAGFRLLKLLERKYDAVAANPPYMGDLNMGEVVKRHLSSDFPNACSDLFAAFIARACQFSSTTAKIAMVVQRVVMYNGDYRELREFLSRICLPTTVAVIGSGGFSEISGAKVDSILFVIRRAENQTTEGNACFVDVTGDVDKAEALQAAIAAGQSDKRIHLVLPSRFSVIPGSPWAFELSDRTVELFESWPSLGQLANCKAGISTGSDPRFLRHTWEIRDAGSRWRPVADGGEHVRWWRTPIYLLDVQGNFTRPRSNVNESGNAACAIRNLAVQGSAGITYLKNAGNRFAGRLIDKGVYFLDTGRCLFPPEEYKTALLGILNTRCASQLLCLIGGGGSFVNADVERLPFAILQNESGNLSSLVDRAVSLVKQLESTSVSMAAAAFMGGTLPEAAKALSDRVSALVADLSSVEESIEQAVRAHYGLPDDVPEPFPWRSEKTLSQAASDVILTVVLRLLGYRQDDEHAADDCADGDGILPVTEGAGESTVVDRLRNYLHTHFSDECERDFAGLAGSSLDEWVRAGLFEYHVSQFENRPIAWQIQSNKFAARTKPAFACLIYYHKLDADLLEKIRTQYVGPLRQRWETELRGIESVVLAARSERQTARRTELGDLIKELQDFDACLLAVRESGFETAGLRQFAIQDSLLCMKARWLRRLSETIQSGPLTGWKTKADDAKIHEKLSDWIDEAMVHLDYHCSRVAPEEWKSADDPTPASLAALICKKPASSVASALEHANARWWSWLDEVVLAPLRHEMSQKKEALKGIQAELKQLSRHEFDVIADLKDQERRLKREVKELKDELDRVKDRAEQVRETIGAWQCREAAGWEPWLAGQPIYDAISSVDGRRRPPKTVPEWVAQERSYVPDINDGVRVNIAPLQKAALLAADVLAKKDLDKAIADRAEWRADERRWCREGKLPQPGWWPDKEES